MHFPDEHPEIGNFRIVDVSGETEEQALILNVWVATEYLEEYE